MRTVLVTGGTGFIGRHVVERLAGEGAHVKVLARRPEAAAQALGRGAEIVPGDIRDYPAVRRAASGAEHVLHLAALARVWAPRRADFHAVNVTGVANVLRAARAAGAARVVHVSTILTLPPYRPAPARGVALRPTPYEASKRTGEALVEAFVASGGDAVIVHPTRVYGPGPLDDANAVTRTIALYLSGRLRVLPADGGAQANYVHVADVAAGIVGAARRGARGEHYVLGGENATLPQVLALAGEAAGVHPRTIAIPPALALAAASLLEWSGRWTGGPAITRRWLRALLEDRRADVGAAHRALDFESRPLVQGVREVVRYLRDSSAPRDPAAGRG